MNPTNDKLVTWASELRRMLKSDAFEYAVYLQRQDYQNRFFTSGLADREMRERAYNLNAALDDLLSSMQTIVLVAQQINSEEE